MAELGEFTKEACDEAGKRVQSMLESMQPKKRLEFMESYTFIVAFLEAAKKKAKSVHEAPTEEIEVPKHGSHAKHAKA